jgi:release factor glutamine methyltransferase
VSNWPSVESARIRWASMTASDPAFGDLVLALRTAGCVFAEDEARLLVESAASPAELTARVQRRIAGEPLEVILGWAEFAGLRVQVDPGVFVPRRRTEYLVRRALRLAHPGATVVDLCCGSGALGLAMAAGMPGLRVFASDIEPSAVECARRNLAGVGEVLTGDLFDAMPAALRGAVDLLLVNAPYVPTDEIAGMPPEARDHEPRVTLDGGSDGLDVHRRVAAEAPNWLRLGGTLLIETSREQALLAVDLFADAGLEPRVVHSRKRAATVVLGTRS